MNEIPLNVGDKVNKSKGYKFPGTVVSVFTTTTGELRFVVEMDEFHLLHIFNRSQLIKL
jgi:hypothetical protein